MDSRERWQALQGHLSAARQALADGSRARALDEVDAALAIDPDFTAAVSLRERIAMIDAPPLARPAPAAVAAPEAPMRRTLDFPQPVRAAAPRPLVSAEGYARFEERARRRRIERRTEAARAAIAAGHLSEAKSAIEEIRTLDPSAPEIVALCAAISASRRSGAGEHSGWHVGPQLVAAAVFATIVLAAPLVEKPPGLLSYPISMVAALVSTAEPAPLSASPADDVPVSSRDAASESIVSDTISPSDMRPRSSMVRLAEFAPPVSTIPLPSPTPSRTPAPVAGPVLPAPTSVVASLPPPSVPAPPPVAVASNVAAERPIVEARVEPKVDDDGLVRRTLLDYKNAYEALDARSAHAVWPVVNERALARAFDGLESQHLMFDACDVQVNGDAAAATCRGTARYVAKIGSRDPRTEPRVWNFTLRKTGQDWKIESARAER